MNYNYNFPLLIIVVLLLLHYATRGEYHNKAAATKIMHEAQDRAMILAAYLQKTYGVGEPDDKRGGDNSVSNDTHAKRVATAILRGYNFEEVYENDPRNLAGTTSFTIAKKIMYLCVRQRENPAEIVDINTLMFVLLHEISHIGNYDGWAHGMDFWLVFAFVLRAAIRCGVYIPVDYRRWPQKYCGIMITYAPSMDPALGMLDGEVY